MGSRTENPSNAIFTRTTCHASSVEIRFALVCIGGAGLSPYTQITPDDPFLALLDLATLM